ncbi:hypothetical protein PV11_06966 [Exophiala sideris]|uniref:Zn(2)-C6 fungal-type domain-containing protein n=1 Tax=Exophiala sideris TaxID=1016849 RepID=A0A0D1YEZ3_9EURO|nr:hypothetical protein PV11_06966 [Exophiala sideris]
MATGSRSRTGCLTCRIRKKKCDEQRPVCQTCHSSELTCYGYSAPLPNWYTNKPNWEEVKKSDEARAIQARAETRYKIRRKAALKKADSNCCAIPVNTRDGDDRLDHHSYRSLSDLVVHNISTIAATSSRVAVTPNTWQLCPETIWWDSAISNLAPATQTSAGQDTRLLTMFLEVIHPITHGFHPLLSRRDRSWMLNRLVSDSALYSAALSVSACFDHSLTQPPRNDEIGICAKVRELQSITMNQLQTRIHAFVTEKNLSLPEFVATGIQLLDVVLNLINLEIFSMLQGHWEIHHRAARILLNHIEILSLSKIGPSVGPKTSAIEFVLSMLPPTDDRRRSMEFCITNYVWIDVLATATFGLASYTPSAFDYLGLLQLGQIKPQNAMGCQGWIMAIVLRIATLEQWRMTWNMQTCTSSAIAELIQRGNQLAENLRFGIEKLEHEGDQASASSALSLKEDCRLVSMLWAYAAQVFLQVTMLGVGQTRSCIDQMIIRTVLQKLEELPTRLVIRVCWPYTIAGCMSIVEYHGRFRQIVARTMQQSQPPGMTWKGLMVMEECWRLRQIRGNSNVGWREAMESLDARVLLI